MKLRSGTAARPLPTLSRWIARRSLAGASTHTLRVLFGRRALPLLVVGFVVAGCGASGATLERSSDGDGWWILDEDGFFLQDASFPTVAQAGQRWTLEYSSGRQTTEIVAFDQTSGMTGVVESQSVVVGEATVDGTKMTLRQFAGLPSKDIPPSVGAVWLDGSLLIQFGGSGLDEDELRAHLQHLQRVDRDRFQAVVDAAQQRTKSLPKTAPTTSVPIGSPPRDNAGGLTEEQTQVALEIAASDPSVATITKDHAATFRVLGPTT